MTPYGAIDLGLHWAICQEIPLISISKLSLTCISFEFVTIDEGNVVTDLLTLNADSNKDVLQLDSKLLRLASPLISKSLMHLFNLSSMSRVIPSDWKLARITPIYKGKGSLNAEANCRPISVLSHVEKIFEKHVHKQLIEYLKDHVFITPYQSAYLKKHSTVTCLYRVVDDLCENINDGDLCGECFLDIEKCFDSINHKILFQKLEVLWYWHNFARVVPKPFTWSFTMCTHK